MRTRNVVLVLVAVATMIAFASLSETKKANLLLLDWANRGSKERPPTAVLIEMGLKDKEPEKWSGRAVVSGAKVVHREGYRFRPDDKLLDKDRWEASSHRGLRVPARNPAVARMEGIATVGVVLHLDDIKDDATLTLTTAREEAEKADVKLKDVLAGRTQELWEGKARVRLMTTASPLTSGANEDDFPTAAYGPDGTLWVAYISYRLRDKERRIEQKNLKEQPSDFKALYTPEFADQLFVKYFRDGKWSEPLAITGPKEDLVRCGIAVDREGKVWVIYSANRNGSHQIFVRSLTGQEGKPPRLGEEQQFPTMKGSGPDVNPVICTVQDGSMCAVWQANDDKIRRGGTGDYRWSKDMAEGGRGWGPGNENSVWGHAVTAGLDGKCWVAYDYYNRNTGDYDIKVLLKGGDGREVGIASRRFEARPSLACDAKGRLWIAYEEGPEKWGHDYGALAEGGEPLYSSRSVRVVCLENGKLMKPVAELPTSTVKAPISGDAQRTQRFEKATRYAYPRLGLDGKGRLWLTYRQSSSSRYSSHLGSYWLSYARRLDGDKWTDPIEVHHSDGLLDSRPVLLPHASGGLLIVHNTDGRYTTPNDIQNRIYTSYLNLPGEPVEPKLAPHDAGTVPTPATAAGQKEQEDLKRIRDYRIETGGKKYQLLRGEFHRHTEISWDGGPDGSLEDMFRYAIDAAALDWIGNGDHDNGGGREYSWWLTQKLTDAYTVKDRFTPLFCYERSVSYPHGHRNCLFAQRGVRTLPRLAQPDQDKRVAGIHADDTKMLYRYLKEFDGICASHTSATGMGTDWRDNDPKVEPIVEIYQGDRNSYEMEEAPRAGYDPKGDKKPANIAGWYPKGYINLALAKGYRLGFESSSDHWSTHISYCVAVAEKHDRAGVLAALKKRHCYAATDNIVLDVRSGEHLMGDEFQTKAPPALQIKVRGTDLLKSVEILKDSKVVATFEPGRRDYDGEWKDAQPDAGVHYYYVRVQQKDGQLAWASPMWIDYAK
ncbi:MAG TPA: hypothetical protein VH643_08025 [Gemmataceae bacterium]|jgi:hypothetical protein